VPVDTSIYQNQTKPDPLGAVGGAIGIANQFTQNRILQNNAQQSNLGLAADQANMQNLQQAMNPDGTLDVGKYNSLTANSPGAYRGTQFMQAAANASTAQTGAASAGMNLASDQVNNFATRAAPLLAQPVVKGQPDPVTPDAVLGIATDMLHSGMISRQQWARMNVEVRTTPNLRVYLQNKLGGAIGAAAQTTPGPAIQTPGGVVTPTTQQNIVRATTPAATPSAIGGTSAAAPGSVTSMAPGATDTIAANVNAYNADQQVASGKLANTRSLISAIPLMEQLGPGGAGPGSNQWNQVKSFLVSQNVISPDATNVDVRQEAKKYLDKYVATNPIAGRSDQAQNLAQQSNSNLDISMKAALALAKGAVGYDRMDAAFPTYYAKLHPNMSQAGPDYLSSKTQYYANMDPRGFSFDTLNPAEQRDLLKTIGPKGSPSYEKFKNSVQAYHDTLGAGGNQ
jgi:hypothetical protein